MPTKTKAPARVALPLTDETLALRSKLAFLAMEKESITVTLESAQLPLFGGDAELQNIVERVADESAELPHKVTSVTLSSGSKSVTLDANTRAKADKLLRRKPHQLTAPHKK